MFSWPHSQAHESVLRIVFSVLVTCLILITSRFAEANPTAPTVPQASPERILIMVVLGENIGLREDRIRARAQYVVEENLHAEIVSDEEAFVQVGTSFQKMLEDCRGAAPCYARLVGSVDARYLLVLSIRKVRDLVLFGSRLIDLDVQKVLGKAISRHSSQEELEAAITTQLQKTVPELMWRPYGALQLNVQPPGSEVMVNDSIVGLSPIPRIDDLLVGRYRVQARLKGHTTVSTTVAVNRAETTNADISLLPTDEIMSKWWFWVSVGVLVVSGAAAGIMSTNNSMPTLCSSPDPDRCP